MKAKNKAAQELGRKGGKSTSKAKRKAVRDNLAKARKSRWPKKPTR